jgi:hypothetical protein
MMTVEKFQQLAAIAARDEDEVDKSIALLQCFTGMTEPEIEAMPPAKFNRLMRKIRRDMNAQQYVLHNTKPESIIRANGRWYKLDHSVSTAGKYVDGVLMGNDLVANLHMILASMATPLRLTIRGFRPYELPHEVKAQDMLSAKFRHAYHAAVFFYAVYSSSMRSIQPYLAQTMTMPEAAKIINQMTAPLGGYGMPKWLANLKV